MPSDVAADASAGDGEADLASVWPVSLPGIEIETGPQPAGGEVLLRMADGEDAECAALVAAAVVLRRLRVVEMRCDADTGYVDIRGRLS
jgi:hypothetical protein